jgi:hypothetical protein
VAKQRLGAQPLKLEEIVDYHKDCEQSLQLYFSENNPEIQNVLIQYFPDELEEDAKTKLLDIRIKELERSSSLVLLAAIEAWFMIDVKNRQAANLTDDFSLNLINWKIEKSKYILLDDNFWNIWKTHNPTLTITVFKKTWSCNDFIGVLKDFFKYRHWLAHGRHFPAKTQKHEYPFRGIHDLAYVVLTSFQFEGV